MSKSAVDSFILKTGFEYKAAYVLNVFKLVLNTIRLSKVDCVQKTYLFFLQIFKKILQNLQFASKESWIGLGRDRELSPNP